jgi:serine/threonine protein kinase
MERAEKNLMEDIAYRKKKKCKWTEQEIVEFWHQLIQVFAYCQFCEISHNDIKPQNILISKDKKPKVSDFGTSKQMEEQFNRGAGQMGEVTNRHLFYTPLYASPNVVQKVPKINYYIEDVFSLGMTFL